MALVVAGLIVVLLPLPGQDREVPGRLDDLLLQAEEGTAAALSVFRAEADAADSHQGVGLVLRPASFPKGGP